jgi:putative ABC transport system permease protein
VIPGDVLVTSIRPIGLDEGIEEQVLAVPGIQHASPIGRFDLAIGGSRVDGAAVRGSDLLADGRLVFVAGDRRQALLALDQGGFIVLPESMARRFEAAVGDLLVLIGADGSEVGLEVAGIVRHSIPGRGGESALVNWGNATSLFGALGADAYAVRYTPGQEASAAPQLEAAARLLALEPRPLDAALGALSDTLDRLFSVFDVLAAIAVVVAGLGIVNTLTMNVLERVREIGVLRAAGMTRRQIARMVVVEAGILGLSGAILGVVLGLIVAAFMLAIGGGLPLAAAMDPPWLVMGFALVAGVVVAMLAAYYPARVASRMSIVRAVQFE